MPTGLYDKGRQAFLEGKINWATDTIKVVLVAHTHLPNLGGYEYLSDIDPLDLVGVPQTLSNKTATNGVADAADIIFPDVTGPQVKALIIYKETDVDTTSPLIAYIDNMTGFPFNPSGAKVSIHWDSGANKIFRL
jgi:hypothetical protein